MKTIRSIAFVAALGLTTQTNCATLHWDGADTTADADGGSGSWGALPTNWNAAAVAGALAGWNSGTPDSAVFAGTAGTIVIEPAGVTANALVFSVSGYTIQGGTLTLAGSTPSVSGSGSAVISAVVAGSAGLAKTGSGTLTLSGTNTYSGTTDFGGGALILAHDGALGTSTLNISATGLTTQASGSRLIANTISIAQNHTFAGGATDSLEISGAIIADGASRTLTNTNTGNTATDALKFSGTVTINNGSGTRTLTIAGAGNTTLAGLLQNGNSTGSLTKSGGGTLTLSGTANTYTGVTTIGASSAVRVTVLANGGANSSIGAASAASSNLILTGTLAYAGTTASTTNRLFTVNSTTGTTLANDSANAVHTLTFSGTGALGLGTNNTARSLTLAGSNTGDNRISPALNNNGTGLVSLVKSGAGTWIMSGTNGYTGGTTVSSGTLVTGNTSALGAGQITVAPGAVLRIGDGIINALALGANATLIINGTLRPGSVASAITLAGTGTYTFNGTLDLNGAFDAAAVGAYTLIAGGVGAGNYTDTLVGVSGFSHAGHTATFAQGVLTIVPEHKHGGILAGGLIAHLILRRRRRA